MSMNNEEWKMKNEKLRCIFALGKNDFYYTVGEGLAPPAYLHENQIRAWVPAPSTPRPLQKIFQLWRKSTVFILHFN